MLHTVHFTKKYLLKCKIMKMDHNIPQIGFVECVCLFK